MADKPHTEADLFKALRNAHNAGDYASAKRIAQMIKTQRTGVVPGDKTTASSLGGIGKAALSGVTKGAIEIPGLIGDIGNVARMPGNALADLVLGAGTSAKQDAAMSEANKNYMGFDPRVPTSQDVSDFVEKNITGQLYQPQTSAEKFAYTAGRFLPAGMLGPGSAASKTGGTLAASAMSEGAGQVFEGSELEPYARIAGAVAGGVPGSYLGDLLTTKPIAGQTIGSMNILRQFGPDDATGISKLGPDAMLLDASPSTVSLAQGLAAAPGKARDTLINALAARDVARSSRLDKGVQNILGKARDPERLKKAIDKAAQRKAAPMYEAAKSGAQPLPQGMANILASQLTHPAASMAKSSRGVMSSIMDDVDDALASGNARTTVERLHNIRQNLDSQIVWDNNAFSNLSSADKAAQMPLKTARMHIDEILKNRFGFDAPDAIVSQSKKAQSDIDFGREALDGGKTAMWPDTFRREVGKRDRRMVQEGMKADIKTAAGTQSNDLAALKKKVGGDGDFNRDKLATAFSNDKVNDLVSLVDSEATKARSYSDVARNSQTAQRQAAQKALEGFQFNATGSETLTGMTKQGLAKIVNSMLAKGTSMSSSKTQEALLKALMSSGKDAQDIVSAVAKFGPLGQGAVIRALLAANTAPR